MIADTPHLVNLLQDVFGTVTMIDLRPRDAIILKAIFRTYAPLAEVWVYGSRVFDHGHETSNLDLAVRNSGALDAPLQNLATLRSAIEDSSLPFLVDLHDWALLPENLRRQIAAGHFVLVIPVTTAPLIATDGSP